MITTEQLQRLAPTAKPELVAAIVRNWGAAERAGITTPVRTQHFLAQIATETGGFRSIDESLNYSVDGLRATFGKHRISDADIEKYGRKPGRAANQEAIGNTVYGGTWGATNLGNTQPGDGYRYRGGGFIQTTGRANYARAGYADHPEELRDPDKGFLAALIYWTDRGCNAIADTDDVTAVRKRVNGGANGLAEAKRYTAVARMIWDAPADLRPVPQTQAPTPRPRPVPPEVRDEDPADATRGPDAPAAAPTTSTAAGAAAGALAVGAAGSAGLWWLVGLIAVATVLFLTRSRWLRLFRK